jgi:hypothetical protein
MVDILENPRDMATNAKTRVVLDAASGHLMHAQIIAGRNLTPAANIIGRYVAVGLIAVPGSLGKGTS